jgi:hypothetical protein
VKKVKLLDLLFPKPKPAKKPPARRPVVTIRKIEPEPPAEDIILNEFGDYRRANDNPNVIRVDQDRPKGFPKKLFEFLAVAGVSYRLDNAESFIAGRDRELSLRRERVDDNHPNALAVYGLWHDAAGEQHTAHLGYVPREANDAIGEQPVAANLVAMYLAADGRNPGIRMDIWTVQKKRGS